MPLMTKANSPKVMQVSGRPTMRRTGATTALTMTKTAASTKKAVSSLPCAVRNEIAGKNSTTTHSPAAMAITLRAKFHNVLIKLKYKGDFAEALEPNSTDVPPYLVRGLGGR